MPVNCIIEPEILFLLILNQGYATLPCQRFGHKAAANKLSIQYARMQLAHNLLADRFIWYVRHVWIRHLRQSSKRQGIKVGTQPLRSRGSPSV